MILVIDGKLESQKVGNWKVSSVMMVGNQELRLLWAGSGTSDQKEVFPLQKETSEVWVSLPSGS